MLKQWLNLFVLSMVGLVPVAALADIAVQLKQDNSVRITSEEDTSSVSNAVDEVLADGPVLEDDAAALNIRFPKYSPALYVLESGEDIDLVANGMLPGSAAATVRAWSVFDGRFISEFDHALTDGKWGIKPAHLDLLAPGEYELQVTLTAPGLREVQIAHRYIVLPAGSDISDSDSWYDDPAGIDLLPSRPIIPGEGFTEWAPGPDARVFYVSSKGSDSNDGLSEASPLKTLKAAHGKVRSGQGDWILIKAGDTLNAGFGSFNKSGKSPELPLYIGVYGEGDRPVINNSNTTFMFTFGRIDHLVMQGLHIKATDRSGGERGIYWLANGKNILFEDCKIEGFKDNVAFVASEVGSIQDVTLRRCIIIDAWANGKDGGHSQGFYAGKVKNILVDECFFDHNGWNPEKSGAYRTMFNHNVYIQATSLNANFYRSVFSRGASHGVQNRCGGEIVENLFVRNALATFVSTNKSYVANNVVLESDDISTKPGLARGSGIEVFPSTHVVVENNIIAHKRGRANHLEAIDIKWEDRGWFKGGEYAVVVRNNIAASWPMWDKNGAIAVTTGRATVKEFVGNVMDKVSGGSANVRFADPSRSADDYLSGGWDAFLEGGRERRRTEWDPQFTAETFNAWLREGYRVVVGGA